MQFGGFQTGVMTDWWNWTAVNALWWISVRCYGSLENFSRVMAICWIWTLCYGSFVVLNCTLWQFGGFLPGVIVVLWISTRWYGSLLDFNWVLKRLDGCEPGVLADWWILAGCYAILVDFSTELWHVDFNWVLITLREETLFFPRPRTAYRSPVP